VEEGRKPASTDDGRASKSGDPEDSRPEGNESDGFLRELILDDALLAYDKPLDRGTVVGRFVIATLIGRGGMGTVYRAHDPSLHRDVAVKVLPSQWSRNPERRARFLQEARTAAAISHANIAVVHEVGEADGHVFIAMELVDGETLRARMATDLDLAEAVRLTREIARGLARAHEKGVVHRDLKPENVMVTRHGDVKILDFGLAKVRGEELQTPNALAHDEMVAETRDGRILGTPAYMSPEQARGMETDARTDVFALGVMLHEMVTGERPFLGETTQDVVTAILRDAPRPPSESNSDIPEEIDRIIGRCLEKSRDARFAGGQEVFDALSTVAAVSGGPSLQSQRWARRNADGLSPDAPPTRVSHWNSGRRWWALLALAGLALAGLPLGYREHRKNAAVADAVPASAVPGHAAASSGKAITDQHPPKTKSPEAAAAYAAALQDFRDGSMAVAKDDLVRATKLDPSFAAAHLGLFMRNEGVREDFAVASQFRGSLDERGQLLLHAEEARTPDPPDRGELVVRLRAVLDRFPDDAEVLYYLGEALQANGRTKEARDALERAVTIDPQFAGALSLLVGIDLDANDLGHALETSERCLRVSPAAASCLRHRARLHRVVGQCAEFEADARRMTLVEPNGPRADEYLALAIAARGAPVESVRAALDKWLALTIANDPSSEKRSKALAALELDGFIGDLAAATADARELESLLADNTSEAAHAGPTMALIQLLEEQGEPGKALEAAEAFERRIPAWTADSPVIRLYLLYVRHRIRRIGDAEFKQARDGLVTTSVKSDPPQSVRLDTARLYSAFAETPEEVSDALDHIDAPSLLTWATGRQTYFGRMYLLADKTDEALPPLRRAAGQCGFMPDLEELVGGEWIQSHRGRLIRHLLLGQALEANGDKPGACDTYGYILDGWKNPKPRSITVEKAKERVKALACAR
jgi:eukaryotic-like serine/threonine-protein kinase